MLPDEDQLTLCENVPTDPAAKHIMQLSKSKLTVCLSIWFECSVDRLSPDRKNLHFMIAIIL